MAGPNPHFITSASWSQIISVMYPDIHTSTHSVPPVYFNQVPYRREIVPGTGLPALVLEQPGAARIHNFERVNLQPTPSPPHVLFSPFTEPFRRLKSRKGSQQTRTTLKSVQETDVKDDTAQAQVLRNLQVLGKSRKEAMFIISQLNFPDYLSDQAYAAAVAQLPAVPVDPKTSQKRDGDFDLLVIHHQHGILAGELKTVGKDPMYGTDAVVSEVIKEAVQQLEKSKNVLSHLVSDITSHGVTVRTTLFLPFVSGDQLRRIFTDSENSQLLEDACKILDAADATEAVKLCCCADQLSDPEKWWEVTDDVVQELEAWWQTLMASTGPPLSDQVYLDLVARFVGPATSVSVHCSTGPRVKVKTVDQAVSELGRRLTTLVLTPEQVDILQFFSWEPLVYLTGPPGTGKTIVLTLVGLCWLHCGQNIHLVSVQDESRTATRLIKNQLEKTLAAYSKTPPGCGRVFLHHYDLWKESEKDRAIRDLATHGPHLFLICDELFDPGYASGFGPGPAVPRYFHDLVTALKARVQELTVWTAGISHTDAPPQSSVFKLTTPLRSAPAVLREVGTVIASTWKHTVHPYNNTVFPTAGDGLQVEELVHDSDRNGHTGDRPEQCLLCGDNVAAKLRHLRLGVPGSTVCPRDVLVLTYDMKYLRRDDADDINTTCRLVQALRDAGLAVWMMTDRREDRATWEKEASEVAEAARNEIVVTDYNSVHGMERKVVVVLGDQPWLKLYAASRATVQLVIVKTMKTR